jgi:diadenosine tetraphosphate (Ap4A) HIT family hydrolase
MADCPLCAVVDGLSRAERHRAPGRDEVYRKVADLPTAVAVLGHDQFYRGYTMVIARAHATELHDLSQEAATAYYLDMLRVARAIAAAFRPRKMNYEVLGNTVAHLHWHLFPRYADDPTPQRPVWEHAHASVVPDEARYAETIAAIRRYL